ncbi:hypothetical protein AB0M29_22510 [Streptomyces sp. NPDC051976]|uniref:hypothetical protein n=1 Tax=Streptomyces sp. NPDC051976 TaxID=3154947 RepID=UPI00341F4AFF
MGIPNEDRLENLCRTDMEKIEADVSDVRAALKKVHDVMGAKTWVGATADAWATDFDGRMISLNRLFDSFPAEEQALIAKAQKDQAASDRKYHGHA